MQSKEEIRARHRNSARAMPARRPLEQPPPGSPATAWPGPPHSPDGATATFAAYLACGPEPPTLPLITALHDAGHRVLLPVCEPDRALSWVFWDPDSEFVRSRYAPIQEPAGERHGLEVIREAGGLFLPATAVDLTGNRIGQGGGYYDKFLADAERRRACMAPQGRGHLRRRTAACRSIPARGSTVPSTPCSHPSGLVRLT